METFNKHRIKKIIEYNLKKFRINSIEYKNDYSTTDPSGIKGLINNDNHLTSWYQKPREHRLGLGKTKYTIQETNQQLRDFLTETIIDIFCGTNSEGNYTKADERIYNIKPSNVKNKKDIEQPFIIRRGNQEFKITTDGIYINNNKLEEKKYNIFQRLINSIKKIILKVKR
jgi:hypothetical protein